MTLRDAYTATYAQMKPQIQGTCGIYSFWYATLLLHHLNGTKYPDVPFPRACHNAGGQLGPSLRNAAKQLGSGQGELLTAAEMVALIGMTVYSCTTYHRYNFLRAGRKGFIKEKLAANRPIIFAYICGKGPVTSKTAAGTAQDDYGPHWSLLIEESATHYTYINPHEDNTTHAAKLETHPKDDVLASMDKVDDVKYDRWWAKTTTRKLVRYANLTKTDAVLRDYDLGKKRAAGQKLNNVLIAVG